MESVINKERCPICKQPGHKKENCPVLSIIKKHTPTINDSVEGSSPPEVFVGSWNWPNVYYGILSPNEYGNTEIFSMPELWYKYRLSIERILSYRSKMVYLRKQGNVKRHSDKNIDVMQEIAMAVKHVDIEAEVKRDGNIKIVNDLSWPIIGMPTSLNRLSLQTNPKIPLKIEKVVGDYDMKATHSIIQLYKKGIEISNIIKLLSVGLLGIKNERKLVPSRWAVTAVDDVIGKWLLEEIKHYDVLDDYRVFHAEYLGNHYEILLLPFPWSFEVIEVKISTEERGRLYISKDHEGYRGRKDYASNVMGAYYANRLGVVEYLSRIKKQASVLIFREVKPTYYAACGVGILRETIRDALNKPPEITSTLEDAFRIISSRISIPLDILIRNSWLLKEIKRQKKLSDFFN